MLRSRELTFVSIATVLGLSGLALAQSAPGVESLRFSKPVTVIQLDMQKLLGQPSRLSWSPDGQHLYLQTLEGSFGRPDVKLHHYALSAKTWTLDILQVEPEWASAYWIGKSGQSSLDDPPLKIELQTEKRQERATSLPQGGGLARGGTSPDINENDQLSILGQQVVGIIRLRLQGETIGVFENTVLVPGLTYGWGPMGSRVIAFATEKSGRVVVMDDRGHKQEVAGSKDAILPAWSPDGDRIVWLQRSSRGRFLLQVSGVSIS